MEQTDQKLPVLSSDELGYTPPTVARLHYTGIGQRYKRASVRPGDDNVVGVFSAAFEGR